PGGYTKKIIMVPTDVIESSAQRMAEFRHRLHQIPELGYEEYKTAAAIRAELDALQIPHVDGVPNAPTATIAWLGDPARPCVALRADIDALPILEQTGQPYASTHPGRMHACGHDGHTATLMGAAGLLKPVAEKLGVCIKLIWQPAEEGGGGAMRLVNAGVLDGRVGPKVRAIYGLHGWPTLKIGTVSTRPGELLAATDTFTATFIGKGCHGAFPHLGVDPIVTAAEAVLNVQQFVSREFDPTDSAVVTIGQFNAGTATNVIPDEATIAGTARTLSDAARIEIRRSIERRFTGIASANRCKLEFDWQVGYPPTVNDPAHADIVAAAAKAALGSSSFLPAARPVMGGEDFAYYLEKVPGCFFFVGVEPIDRTGYPSLHNDHYDFTDASIAVGIRMYVELARRFSQQPAEL
ncbi:MAG TPA: M20 family metallopeptidase, partial [Tepidisphaeraceae bacterium]|nr:M20 family metallopeptidase [Tepidisphaeraceae bacterium]